MEVQLPAGRNNSRPVAPLAVRLHNRNYKIQLYIYLYNAKSQEKSFMCRFYGGKQSLTSKELKESINHV